MTDARGATLPRAKPRTRWTEGELRTLRRAWGEVTLHTLRATLPGRSTGAIAVKARELGLPFGMPQGFCSLAEAVRRSALCPRVLRKLLAREGIPVQNYLFLRKRHGGTHWRMVEWDRVRDAVAEHFTVMESMGHAARRLRIDPHTLRYALAAKGLRNPRRGPWSLPTPVIDDAVRDYLRNPQSNFTRVHYAKVLRRLGWA